DRLPARGRHRHRLHLHREMKVALSIAALASLAAIPPRPKLVRTLNESRWESATLRSGWVIPLDKAVARYQRDRHRYESIERMRPGGMPAPVVFAIHG